MFGSDFPNQVNAGIAAILAADFLTTEQKGRHFVLQQRRTLSSSEPLSVHNRTVTETA
jgi:hypothetical protein